MQQEAADIHVALYAFLADCVQGLPCQWSAHLDSCSTSQLGQLSALSIDVKPSLHVCATADNMADVNMYVPVLADHTLFRSPHALDVQWSNACRHRLEAKQHM